MWTCHKCGKPVYFAERRQSLGFDWHPNCLRCEECGKILNPGQHAEHKAAPFCHIPCYSALFGPKLFGHGSTVESHRSFGQRSKSFIRTETELQNKLKEYNRFYTSTPRCQLQSREVNQRLVLEGVLKIYWGTHCSIRLKEYDDNRVIARHKKTLSLGFQYGNLNFEESDGCWWFPEVGTAGPEPGAGPGLGDPPSGPASDLHKWETLTKLDKEGNAVLNLQLLESLVDNQIEPNRREFITVQRSQSVRVGVRTTQPRSVTLPRVLTDKDQLRSIREHVGGGGGGGDGLTDESSCSDDSSDEVDCVSSAVDYPSAVKEESAISSVRQGVSDSQGVSSRRSNVGFTNFLLDMINGNDCVDDDSDSIDAADSGEITLAGNAVDRNTAQAPNVVDDDTTIAVNAATNTAIAQNSADSQTAIAENSVDDNTVAEISVENNNIAENYVGNNNMVKDSDGDTTLTENPVERNVSLTENSNNLPTDNAMTDPIPSYQPGDESKDLTPNSSNSQKRVLTEGKRGLAADLSSQRGGESQISADLAGNDLSSQPAEASSRKGLPAANAPSAVEDGLKGVGVSFKLGVYASRPAPRIKTAATPPRRNDAKRHSLPPSAALLLEAARRERAAAKKERLAAKKDQSAGEKEAGGGPRALRRRHGVKYDKARLRRRSSINGHWYDRDTSVFTPPRHSAMSVWTTSLAHTPDVLAAVLTKYKIESDAGDFALYVVKETGETRLLTDEEIPLLLRVNLGPHEEIAKIYLMNKLETSEVSHKVAQFLKFSYAELRSFVNMFYEEEEKEADRIRYKYISLRQHILTRLRQIDNFHQKPGQGANNQPVQSREETTNQGRADRKQPIRDGQEGNNQLQSCIDNRSQSEERLQTSTGGSSQSGEGTRDGSQSQGGQLVQGHESNA